MYIVDEQDSIDYNGYLLGKADPVSLKTTINGYLKYSIDTLTYASAVGWFIGHTFSPPIERYLSTKEDLYMRQVLMSQNEEKPVAKLSTTASKVSYLIEYVMPVLFNGARNALFIRFIEKAANSMDFSTKNASLPLDLVSGDLIFNALFQLVKVTIEMLPGEDPVSDTVLYLLLVSGVVQYLLQAWCNFTHDLKTKQIEVENTTVSDSSPV